MANKFNILGTFAHFEENQMFLNVRRNYQNYDSEFDVDLISVNLGLSLSQKFLESLNNQEVIAINGRVECDQESRVVLIAEHVVRIEQLKVETST